MSLSTPLTIIGMVNGMIGGTILSLPLLAKSAGYIAVLTVLPITGFFSYYSCRLCVAHLGQQKDLNYAIIKHFSETRFWARFMAIFYDLIVFLNLLFLLFLYFQLIVLQWSGLINDSIINPLVNAVVLFILVFILKYFQFGASLLAYGIISIVGYCIFLVWVIATIKPGPNTMPVFGSGSVDLAAAMGGAFSIQTFFIPILRKNPFQQKYILYTGIAYSIGICVYLYIAYAGSFGILNRQEQIPNPTLIQDYFPDGDWQLIVLECIYLIHLYSAYPQFLLVSKKRFFSIFGIKQTKRGKIPIKEGIYALIFVALCLIVAIFQVNVETLLQINGAVIGFFFIYFLPCLLHIKCLFFTKKLYVSQTPTPPKQIQQQDNQVQLTVKSVKQQIQNNQNHDQIYDKKSIVQHQKKECVEEIIDKSERQYSNNLSSIRKSLTEKYEGTQVSSDEQFDDKKFTCTAKRSDSLIITILDMTLCIIMILLGLFILVNGIISVSK